MYCGNCGFDINTLEICSNCGFKNKKSNSKKIIFSIIAGVLVICLIMVFVFVNIFVGITPERKARIAMNKFNKEIEKCDDILEMFYLCEKNVPSDIRKIFYKSQELEKNDVIRVLNKKDFLNEYKSDFKEVKWLFSDSKMGDVLLDKKLDDNEFSMLFYGGGYNINAQNEVNLSIDMELKDRFYEGSQVWDDDDYEVIKICNNIDRVILFDCKWADPNISKYLYTSDDSYSTTKKISYSKILQKYNELFLDEDDDFFEYASLFNSPTAYCYKGKWYSMPALEVFILIVGNAEDYLLSTENDYDSDYNYNW